MRVGCVSVHKRRRYDANALWSFVLGVAQRRTRREEK